MLRSVHHVFLFLFSKMCDCSKSCCEPPQLPGDCKSVQYGFTCTPPGGCAVIQTTHNITPRVNCCEPQYGGLRWAARCVDAHVLDAVRTQWCPAWNPCTARCWRSSAAAHCPPAASWHPSCLHRNGVRGTCVGGCCQCLVRQQVVWHLCCRLAVLEVDGGPAASSAEAPQSTSQHAAVHAASS